MMVSSLSAQTGQSVISAPSENCLNSWQKFKREPGTSASSGAAGGAGPEGTVLASTGPESTVPPATSGGGGAAEAGERSRELNSRSLGPAGAAAGEEGEAK